VIRADQPVYQGLGQSGHHINHHLSAVARDRMVRIHDAGGTGVEEGLQHHRHLGRVDG
jgi:hypothetical protein